MRIGIGQIAPVLLDRNATIDRIVKAINEAANRGASLVAFGEAILPGYPVWLSRTGGSRFDDSEQKQIHALYLEQAVDPTVGHLDPILSAAVERAVWVVVGIVERAADRGGHSLYCSCVVINPQGSIASIHRKLMPTYEERLCWGTGDGAGLVVHHMDEFRLGALNCWEKWMPLTRAAMYAGGENLHVMLWPGNVRNTELITRFVARESRSYVLSASATLAATDIPETMPLRDQILSSGDDPHDGGSAVAGPDGHWIVEPVRAKESIIIADLDPAIVKQERQNFDPAGHYARPDVLRLIVDRRRQSAAEFLDSE
jgi:nitrilase